MAKQRRFEEFEAIFHSYKNMVFKIAYLTLGNAQEAEDIMQEIFIKVYREQNSYKPEKGKFSSWLYRITVNQCISQRRRKTLSNLSLETFEEEGNDIADKSLQLPEDFMIKQEERKRIQAAMNCLDRKHRAILALRYFDDLSYNEIASILEIPLGTVKSRINTAIKALRNELGKKEATP